MYRQQIELGFRYGITGVDLFFLISGFVIFMSVTKVRNSREFIINRVSRLYPTYWSCVTITFVAIMIFNSANTNINYGSIVGKYLANMTMFQFYLRVGNLDDPYWTMLIELTFYISIICLLKMKLVQYITYISCVALILIIIDDQLIKVYFYSLHMSLSKYYPLVNHFPLFFAGILFYKLSNKLINKMGYFLILSCFIVQAMVFKNGGFAHTAINIYQYLIMLAIYFTLFVLFVNNSLNFIVNKTTLFFGKISYSLYLIHNFIGTKVVIPFFENYFHLQFWPSAIITFIFVILLSSLIYFYIEVPGSKKMKAILNFKSS